MSELFREAILPANLPATFLMFFVGLYWITVLIGLFDFDSLDIDVELEVDMEVDTDLDLDADVDGEVSSGGDSGPGGFKGILFFLGIGEVPLMVFLSFLALFFWLGSMLMNHYLFPGSWIAWAVLLPMFIVLALVTKVVTHPLRGLFRKMNDFAKPTDLHGKICVVALQADHHSTGQAEVEVNDSLIKIRVRPMEKVTLNPGQKAIILTHDEKQDLYWIESFNH